MLSYPRSKSRKMKPGVVALLDALGMGSIWAEKRNIHKLVDSWNDVLDSFYKAAHMKTHKFHFAAFSDTIIIVLIGKELDLVYQMGEILICPFVDAIVKNGVLLRGVISKGDFLFTPTMITGPAICEAQQWYTQPEWIGVSTTPTAAFALDALEREGKDVRQYFIPWPVPLKSGRVQKTWVLAWPARALGKESDLLNQFATRVIGPDVFSKYENTRRFFEYVARRNQAPSDVSPSAEAFAVLGDEIDTALERLRSRWSQSPSERERLVAILLWLMGRDKEEG